jgi:ABC-2 type transport system permease protein
LPFQAISYIPSMIITESFTGDEVFEAIVFQFVWALILIVPIQMLWIVAKKQLIVQGG